MVSLEPPDSTPKRHLIFFSRFIGLMVMSNRRTHRPRNISNNYRPHLCTPCMRSGLIIGPPYVSAPVLSADEILQMLLQYYSRHMLLFRSKDSRIIFDGYLTRKTSSTRKSTLPRRTASRTRNLCRKLYEKPTQTYWPYHHKSSKTKPIVV